MTGDIGHGKSTVAQMITKIEPRAEQFETSNLIIEVADAMHAQLTKPLSAVSVESLNGWIRELPSILSDVVKVQVSYEDLAFTQVDVDNQPELFEKLFVHALFLQADHSRTHQTITAKNKSFYRPFLQWLGGYCPYKIDGGIWFDELIRRAEAESDSVDLSVLSAVRYPADERVVRAAGAQVLEVYWPEKGRLDAGDITEKDRSLVTPDTRIVNNSDVHTLRKSVSQYLNDLQVGRPRAEYIASDEL